MSDDRTNQSSITGVLAVVAAAILGGVVLWLYDRSESTITADTVPANIELEVVDAVTKRPVSGATIDVRGSFKGLVRFDELPRPSSFTTDAEGLARFEDFATAITKTSRLGITRTKTIYPTKYDARVKAAGFSSLQFSEIVYGDESPARPRDVGGRIRFQARFELRKGPEAN